MPDLDATTGSFDTWWAAHHSEITAAADKTVAAFIGYTAGRKSGRASERQRIRSGATPERDGYYVPAELLDTDD